MELSLFLHTEKIVNTDLQVHQQKTISPKRNPNRKLFVFVLLVVALVGLFYYAIDKQNQRSSNSQKLNTLTAKVLQNQALSELEWNELCQLLSVEKGIQVNDCQNCRDYIKALLGGTHDVFLKQYVLKSDKELLKGIKSYQKQIEEHLDKIANPEKHIPNWQNLDIRQRQHLQDIKWNNDIKRQREQQQILECILKNRFYEKENEYHRY